MRGQMLSGFNHLTSAMINLKYSLVSPRVEFLLRNEAISHGHLFAGSRGHDVCSKLRKFWLCAKLLALTDDELLNNCTTHQAWEGAPSLEWGSAFPGEPPWAGDTWAFHKLCGFALPSAAAFAFFRLGFFPLAPFPSGCCLQNSFYLTD